MRSKEEEIELQKIEKRRKEAAEKESLMVDVPQGATGATDRLKYDAASGPENAYTVWNFAQFLKDYFKDKGTFHIDEEIEKEPNKFKVPIAALNLKPDQKLLIGSWGNNGLMEVYMDNTRATFKVATDDRDALHHMVDGILASLEKFGVPQPYEVVVHECSTKAQEIIQEYCKEKGVQCSFEKSEEPRASMSPSKRSG